MRLATVSRRICKQIGLRAARVASNSKPAARGYIAFLSVASRLIDRPNITRSIIKTVTDTTWPPLSLRPRRVAVAGVSILIHPHLGEPDQGVLFARSLSFMPAMVDWLKENVGHYDTVIEI